MMISNNKKYLFLFFFTLIFCIFLILIFVSEPKNYLESDINFRNLKKNQIVSISGLTRMQRHQIKLSFIEKYPKFQIGVFGNHQLKYMRKKSFEKKDFFNYWYGDIGLPEVYHYLLYLENLSKLPTKLLIIQITTPNNDNGANIIDFSGDLPSSVLQSAISFNVKNFNFIETLRFLYVYKIKKTKKQIFKNLRKHIDYSLIYSQIKSLFFEDKNTQKAIEKRIITLSDECLNNLEQINDCPSYEQTKGAFLSDGSTFLYNNNTDVHLRQLKLNESYNVFEEGLISSDYKKIIFFMEAIKDLAKRNNLKHIFFVPPLFEELKIKTSVDKVFDNVILNLDNEVEIIDHRNKFKNRRFFREFDHPSEEYFEELAVQIIEKLKNN